MTGRITTTLGGLAIALATLGTTADGQMMNIPFGGGYGASVGGGGVGIGAARPTYGGYAYGNNLFNTYGYGVGNYGTGMGVGLGSPYYGGYNYGNLYGYSQPGVFSSNYRSYAPGYTYGYGRVGNGYYSNNYGYSGGYYTPNYSYGNRTYAPTGYYNYAPTGYYTYGNRAYRRGLGLRRNRVYYYRR